MSKNNKIGLCIFYFIIFSVIAYFVTANEILTFDTIIRETIYTWRNHTLTAIFITITYAANWQTIVILSLLTLIPSSTRKSFGIPLITSAILSALLYKLVKIIFARPRPHISLQLIEQGGYSFPSGHAMTGLVFYGMLIWLCYKAVKKAREKPIWDGSVEPCKKSFVSIFLNKSFLHTMTVVFSLLIFLIGFSRIYLGVHYPTDVLGGWALGSVLFLFLTMFWEKK
ncbi:MAG: phosphatase PAP2 family protein [Anaerovorax sp.]